MTEENVDTTVDETVDATADAGAAVDGAEKAAKPTRAELLEEEGEIAADYLEELMDVADIDGDIDIDVGDGRAQLSIVCEDDDDSNLRTLVGRDGKTLGALQELSRLAVQTSTGQRSWLMLDIDGFRNNRRDELIKKAKQAIDDVKESGNEFAFKPMNSFERKIIHDQVAQAGLVSESEGEGEGRHVLVRPAHD
ncbi:Jag family protein [Brevibacterium aurantiacum]|uniref:Single-stranded DNA-binding protein n=1 Tax=Brevibacterium aurantiacum TaxID=273384 RepID=A0A2A3ZIE1_BREAU|nr:R3H domain-containing nucleic acid-binding protein [Brevibacterium aurantiacum]MDN5549859.1 single-stranded DNA-binding protein [Brevibacterium sp.]AZL07435.1 single-stranded DNA-binding protein [Brevibacterium aurantiacum]AZL11025.1 single-stranded DNA-binding protein [Brevibacterium aurantiacum]AZL14622.1 single-stranded DNA-binding protein [Brevibacterium aurantiacum]AZT95190.1 single-stranded DNA-binding protein [Brevibacterium aurantiacum]